MLMNDAGSNSAHVHYSPTAKYSIGVRHEYFRDPKVNVTSFQINNLIKRWNKKNEQANFYVKSGVGVARDDGEYDPAAYTGIALDWETRLYFTPYENRFFWADETEQFAMHKARVGIAPYVGDYGDLHTWLMLEAHYDAGEEDTFHVTPLVRFFKGNTLLEAGYNLDGGVMFNFVQRF